VIQAAGIRVRVAGVAIHDGRVLLHRSEHDDFWSLPGGRVQLWETVANALVREMLEEIAVEVVAGPVLWVVENFFDHSGEGHHEVGFYLLMSVPPPITAVDSFMGVESGSDRPAGLEFAWTPVDALDSLDVRPRVVGGLLAEPLPDGRRTIVAGGPPTRVLKSDDCSGPRVR
jgi:ADP-ribose pyrophosphatase YjhB (NUDIX family)